MYEPELTDWVTNNVRPNMVFVDVGAAQGYYTLLAAGLARQVIAFERDVELYEKLLDVVSRRHLWNVTVVPFALFSKRTSGRMGVDPDEFLPGDGDVVAITLDEYLGGRRVDIIKIDVEGAEVDVLLGAQETLAQWGPTLLIEVHHAIRHFGRTVADLENILADAGY